MKSTALFLLTLSSLFGANSHADSQSASPIKVASIICSEALNRDKTISMDLMSVIEDFTTLSLRRNGIERYFPGKKELMDCVVAIAENAEDFESSLVACHNPTRLEWSFNFLFSDIDDEVYQVDLSVKEVVLLSRDNNLNIDSSEKLVLYPEYATVWNRRALIFCPAGFTSWESCHTDIITVARKLLTSFDSTH
mgnify:CR=1 FL=1